MIQNDNPRPKGIVTAMHGGGTTDPFTARMLFGISQIRDHFYKNEERLKFDNLFDPIFQNLSEAKYVKEQYLETIKTHIDNIRTGKSGKYEEGFIRISEDINFHLNIYFKDFFIRGHMALDCLKRLTDQIFNTNIEFFFSSDKNFDKGLEKFKAKYNSGLFQYFIKMLIAERENWFTTFVEMRIKIEHKGFKLDKTTYNLEECNIIPVFPKISNKEIPEEIEILWENLFSFCEDTIVMLLASKLPINDPFIIMHIPEDHRDPLLPLKYKLTISPPQEILEQINL